MEICVALAFGKAIGRGFDAAHSYHSLRATERLFLLPLPPAAERCVLSNVRRVI